MVVNTATHEDSGGIARVISIDRAGLYARTIGELRVVWEYYAATLPDDRDSWRAGAAYVRESSSASMTRESPTTQLTYVLNQFARQRVWAPWEAVFFDVGSGTSMDARPEFRRLRAAALRGEFEIVGAYLSDRLFRNASEAREIKDEFRRRGVEIDYLGKLQGDPRNPMLWQSESQQDLLDEYWAHKTSHNVGLEFERLSLEGRPLGHLPEGYRIASRAESHHGLPGKILTYEANEPLASLIVEGKDRYIAGATFPALAVWSATTAFAGMTPAGRPMNFEWWRMTLQNPKYAGFQMPAKYQGFRPGIGPTPPRPRRRNGTTELVVCKVPALWPLSDFETIVALGTSRKVCAKVRSRYRIALLSSIAHDDRCGHRMKIHRHSRDRIYMGCTAPAVTGRHSNLLRTELAEAELDRMMGSLRFDNPTLLSMIEHEIETLASLQQAAPVLKADPEIGRLQAALAALGDDAPNEIRVPITGRLERLRSSDNARALEGHDTVRRFRSSVADLKHWDHVWATADIAAKNELLRTAGIRVRLAPPPGATSGPAEIRAVDVDDPVFALALAASLDDVALKGPTGLERGNATDLVRLPGRYAALLRGTRLEAAA